MKTCTKCKIEKPFEAFYKHSMLKDGYRPECKECFKLRIKELKKSPLMQLEKQIRSSIMLENKLLAREGKRLCQSCKEIFLIKEMNQGVVCRSCHRKRVKEERSTEIGKLKRQLSGKKYRENNKEYISQREKEYRRKKKLEKETRKDKK